MVTSQDFNQVNTGLTNLKHLLEKKKRSILSLFFAQKIQNIITL